MGSGPGLRNFGTRPGPLLHTHRKEEDLAEQKQPRFNVRLHFQDMTLAPLRRDSPIRIIPLLCTRRILTHSYVPL